MFPFLRASVDNDLETFFLNYERKSKTVYGLL